MRRPQWCGNWRRLAGSRAGKAKGRTGHRSAWDDWPASPDEWSVQGEFLCGTLAAMRVFGIDCGTEVTGFGVVESCLTARESRLVCKAMGGIQLAKNKPLPVRLEQVYRELMRQLEEWQ